MRKVIFGVAAAVFLATPSVPALAQYSYDKPGAHEEDEAEYDDPGKYEETDPRDRDAGVYHGSDEPGPDIDDDIDNDVDHDIDNDVDDEDREYRGETWRDDEGRLRCRRSDGTTGLVVGGAAGALVGRGIDTRGERGTGTILGAAAGALIGRAIERGARCR